MRENSLTPQQKEWRRKWVVLISAGESVLESLIKLAAAFYTGSVGLFADCIHSAVDVAGSFMVWIGVRLAPHKYKKFPYGFYKIENLMALTIGFAILYGAYEILQVFFAGKTELPENIPVGITAVILGMCLDWFWGRFEAKSGRLINSPGIEASGNHTVTDVYSSSIVLVGLVGALFGYNLDRWAALFIAILIGKIGIGILWDNVKVLLDISLPQKQLEAYSKIIGRQPGVQTVKSIRGRNAGSFRFIDVEIGVKVFSIDQADDIVSSVETSLKEHDGTIDSVFTHCTHEFPEIIYIFIPTDETGRKNDIYFGKAKHFTGIKYNRLSNTILESHTDPNPFQNDEEHRGIKLAEHLLDKGADSICCREDLGDKGPGLMFHRFGIDVRITSEENLNDLFEDYFGRSQNVFSDKKEQGKPSTDKVQ